MDSCIGIADPASHMFGRQLRRKQADVAQLSRSNRKSILARNLTLNCAAIAILEGHPSR
jgi:hypothetical protein